MSLTSKWGRGTNRELEEEMKERLVQEGGAERKRKGKKVVAGLSGGTKALRK